MGTEYDTFMKEAAKRRKRILRLSSKGVSQAKIAERVGMSRQRVHQIVSQHAKGIENGKV